ncbi:hypothetical protein AB4K20DRAFT_1919738 [Rhizopus microsporus]
MPSMPSMLALFFFLHLCFWASYRWSNLGCTSDKILIISFINLLTFLAYLFLL